jgi:hypothetical protein
MKQIIRYIVFGSATGLNFNPVLNTSAGKHPFFTKSNF